MSGPTEPRFFATPEELRDWFDANHETERELWVGFYKVGSGRPSITWSQAVDEALCVGWIDGVRKSVDDVSYCNRFTPRRRGSNWSAVNVAKVEALTREGRMRPAGVRAFGERTPARTGVYSYEQDPGASPQAEAERLFREHAEAWAFFQSRPPWYRRTALHWVTSARRPETRRKRLATLIEDSAAGRTIAQLTRPPKPGK